MSVKLNGLIIWSNVSCLSTFLYRFSFSHSDKALKSEFSGRGNTWTDVISREIESNLLAPVYVILMLKGTETSLSTT